MRSLSYTGPTTVSGGQGVLRTQAAGMSICPSTILSHLLRRMCLPHRAAASGMGDSTSLPAGFLVTVEAQVCDGSAGLLLDADAEVAKAWADRSR